MKLNEAIENMFTEQGRCNYKDILSIETQTKIESIRKKARLIGIDTDRELIKQKIFEIILKEGICKKIQTMKECANTILKEYCNIELSELDTRTQYLDNEKNISVFKVEAINTIYATLVEAEEITIKLKNSNNNVTVTKVFSSREKITLLVEYNVNSERIKINISGLFELIRKVIVTIVAAFKSDNKYSEINNVRKKIIAEWSRMVSENCAIKTKRIYDDDLIKDVIKMLDELML